jgi:predicted molibdopterin-dependent oxidoreductase YjgC
MIEGPGRPSGAAIGLHVDERAVRSFPGETIAGLLHRIGLRRSYFCGMGSCFACLINVDGRLVQGCLTPVVDGLRLTTTTPTSFVGPDADGTV